MSDPKQSPSEEAVRAVLDEFGIGDEIDGNDGWRLAAELARARAVIAQHDLCHDLHGKVDARAFADGCAAEQRKLYGCAPDADELESLRQRVEELEHKIETKNRALAHFRSIAGSLGGRP